MSVNAGSAFSTVLVDELVRCGLRHACLAPGSRSTPLAMALAEDERVTLHVTIDERSASFCALGITKATGEPVAVLCTSGSAAANFHPAVLEASHARVPLLVLTADRPPELRDAAANQTVDQLKLYGDAVRWFCEVGVPEARAESVAYWRSVACRAWAEATGRPPGSVHINAAFREPLVPEGDDFSYPLEGRPGNRPWTDVDRARIKPSESTIERLAADIAGTERGVLVVGGIGADPGPLLELASLAGWPLVAEATSGARSGDNAISTYDALLRDGGFAGTHRPELVIRIGNSVLSRALSSFLQPATRQVLIDADGAWLDPTRSLSELVVADPGELCAEVSKALERRDASSWLASWLSAERAARRAIDDYLDALDEASEPGAARDLAALVPEGGLLAVASSMPVRDLDWFMRARGGLRMIANRGTSGIDGFVSTVLGASSATDRTVHALAGDLSMLHDQNGLLLARNEDVNAIFVVLNNDGGGIFNFLPQARHPENFERLWGTPHGLDFRKLAALHDCGYELIGKASDLTAAVGAAEAAGGVHLIEARTNRKRNVALHQEIWQRASEALHQSRGAPT